MEHERTLFSQWFKDQFKDHVFESDKERELVVVSCWAAWQAKEVASLAVLQSDNARILNELSALRAQKDVIQKQLESTQESLRRTDIKQPFIAG